MMQELPPNVGAYPFKPLRRIEFTKMSQTWLAATRGADQPSGQVVLKIARRDQTENFRSNQAAITNEEHWLRKLQSTANHPGLVRLLPIELIGNRPIYSAKTHDPGEPWFIVVGYLAGGSLKDALARQSTVHPRVALQIARQLAVTLSFVHQQGCVHLDLKPDNVMFAKAVPLNSESLSDSPVLIDFGIAKPVRELHYLGGVAAWLAPECVRAMDKHERIPILPSMDIYALGLVLNALLTGQHPGAAETLAVVDSKVLHKKANLKAQRSEQLTRGLNTLIAAMTDENAGRRPTAQQVVVQLDHLLVGMSTPKRKARSGRLMGWTLAGASAVLVLLLGALVLTQMPTNPSGGASDAGSVDGGATADALTSTEAAANTFLAGGNALGEVDDDAAMAGPIGAMTATASATNALTDALTDDASTLTDAGTLTDADIGTNTDALTESLDETNITTTEGVTNERVASDTATGDTATGDTVSVSDSLTATTAAILPATAATAATAATETVTGSTATANSSAMETGRAETRTTATPARSTTPNEDDAGDVDEKSASPNTTGTPSRQPTATRVSPPTATPTFTPLPTLLPVPPPVAVPPAGGSSATAAPNVPVAEPNSSGEPLPDRAVTLLAPANGVDLAGGVEFSWAHDFELGPNEQFEAVFWQAESNRDVSALGLAAASPSSVVIVDLNAYRQQSPGLLVPGTAYRWGVRITDGEGRPLQWVSDGNAFKYVGE